RRLKEIRAGRDEAACREALGKLAACARQDIDGNLLGLAVDAAKQRATLGEISDAMESAFGRYQARTRVVSGVYTQEFGKHPAVEETRKLVTQFEEIEGRRPRILIAKLG